jgi:hypothetical protein
MKHKGFDLEKGLEIQVNLIHDILSLLEEYKKKYPQYEKLLNDDRANTSRQLIRKTSIMISDISDTNLISKGVRNNPKEKIYTEHLIPVNQIAENIEKDFSIQNIKEELMKSKVAILTVTEHNLYEGKDALQKNIYGIKHRTPEQIEKFIKDFELL